MIKTFYITLLLFICSASLSAQESGNRAYGQQRRQPAVNTGQLSSGDGRGIFIEANVLMNIKPDSFVVVFGVAQEGTTAEASNSKVDETIAGLARSLSGMGIPKQDLFVDFITQNKVYEYKPSDSNTVIEEVSGFETKKTIAVKYKDRSQLESIITAATKASIFDLIKVDYVINDIPALRKKLYEDATAVVRQKEEKYRSSFALKLAPVSITNEKYDAFYPGDLYKNYKAYEAGTTYGGYSSNSRVIQKRKSSTLYYEPLEASDFDLVVNPIGIEPLVQMTLYLRVQYAVN